jgi:predicted DNA-binding transcriptional regulator AlpA
MSNDGDEDMVDVVGVAEVSEMLGVERQRISRWRRKGQIPPPYIELRVTPLWRRADIERLRASGSVEGFAQTLEFSPLLGTAEVTALLGVDKSTVARWRARATRGAPPFPMPVRYLRAGPLWLRRDIELFAQARATHIASNGSEAVDE